MFETSVASQSAQVLGQQHDTTATAAAATSDSIPDETIRVQHVRGQRWTVGADETGWRPATVVPFQVAGGTVREDRIETHETERHKAVGVATRVAVRVQQDVREPHVFGVPVPTRHENVQQVQGEAVRAEEPVPVAGRAGHVQEHQGPERSGQDGHSRQSADEPHRRVHSPELPVFVHCQHIRIPESHILRRHDVRGRQGERVEKRRQRYYHRIHHHHNHDRGNIDHPGYRTRATAIRFARWK